MQKVRLYSSAYLLAVFIVLSFLWAALIFSMSNEPATVSADRSGGIADIVAALLVKDFDSLVEVDKVQTVSSIDHIIRKIAHFCIYAVLGALVVLTSLYKNRTLLCHGLVALLFGVAYAASDEIHQYFVPGRGPRITDVILDSFGVLCGILFILFVIGIDRWAVNYIKAASVNDEKISA